METVLMVSRGRHRRDFESEPVTVSTDMTDVVELVLDDGERLQFDAVELRAAVNAVDAPADSGSGNLSPPDILREVA